MKRQRRRAHPARPFVLSILLLLFLGLFSILLGSIRDARPDHSANVARRNALTALAGGDELCRQVHGAQDQCAFIQANCPDEEAGLLSYLTLYYCRLPQAKPLGFIIIALWTGFLFSTIGVAASDFFCVNLSTISTILGMSESFAGVTFLAFGNGSPDVFSTFAAMKSHSGSLAVGELIGAAGFITAVVAGSMAIVRPFKVARKSFVRDVGFFIVAISFSMSFLANGSLALWECAVMVAFYVFYVLTVVCWHWWLARRRRRREREAAARGHFVVPGDADVAEIQPYHDEDDGSRPLPRTEISIEDFNNLERADYLDPDHLDEDEEEEERDKWLGELNSNMRITKAPDGERRNTFNPIRPSLVGALEFRAVLASLEKSRNSQPLPLHPRRYSDAQYLYNTLQQRRVSYDVSDSQLRSPQISSEIMESPSVTVDDGFRKVKSKGSLAFRGRAVSVNDAAGLPLDPRVLKREPVPQLDLLSSSPPSQGNATPGRVSVQNTEAFPSLHDAPRSPVLSVSPPPESETLGRRDSTSHARASTADYLAPPGISNGPQRTNSSSLSLPEGRPNQSRSSSGSVSRGSTFKVLLPSRRSSPRHSPFVSPRTSPFISAQNFKSSNHFIGGDSLLLPSPSASPGSYFPADHLEEEQQKPLEWWPYRILPPPEVMARTLFPTLYGWREKMFWEKLLGIAAAPSFFLLTITLPIVEPDDKDEDSQPIASPKSPAASIAPTDPVASRITMNSEGSVRIPTTVVASMSSNHPHRQTSRTTSLPTVPLLDRTADHTNKPQEWNRWLVIVQCFTAPLFVVFIVWANTSTEPREILLPILYSLVSSLVALFVLLLTTSPTRPPRWHFLLCFVGFAVSVTWISTIANEVVGVLKTIGVIFNMSDAILGLTIFAVGNSLGDLVADITVARLGYPVMALSACFGGPLLNILLGVGLSGLYVMINGAEKRQHKHPGSGLKFKPYHVQVSTTLLISAVALLVTLVGLLIVVPLNGWKMDKRIGWGLISLWCVATVGNVIVEIAGLGDEF